MREQIYRRSIQCTLCAAAFGLLIVFLWWHFRLGLSRYFDADELAYLHWSYNLLSGKRPYFDFFLYVPPGFLVFLVPLFWLGGGVVPLVAGRILAFFVFLGLCLTAAWLFWEVRRSFFAIIAATVLAFLPLPADKFLELRPDNLATLLVLLGLIFQIRESRTRQNLLGFLSGLAYSLSLLVLPKTLPSVFWAVAVATGAIFFSRPQSGHLKCDRRQINTYFWFWVGLALPLIIFVLGILSVGKVDVVVYSLTKLPLEVNRLGEVFVMRPDLFFYPNPIFYGEPGVSQGLVVNHLLWLVGLLVGVGRLVTPFIPAGRAGVWNEILIAGTFFIPVALYILFYPMRHAQYLIPIAVFVAWYVADGLQLVWEKVRKSAIGRGVFVLVFMVVGAYLITLARDVNRPKLSWTNQEELAMLRKILTTIPPETYILDLVGLTLYFRDPYYACCLPFGQYKPFLSRPLPSLVQALEKTQTRYIYQGKLGRLATLTSEDQAYITAHFTPLVGEELLVRRSVQ